MYPLAAHLRPIHVDVHAGELLYLPSLWYHKVQQRTAPVAGDAGNSTHQPCIAVNFWYDMRFDARWSYFQAVEDMTSVARHGKIPATTLARYHEAQQEADEKLQANTTGCADGDFICVGTGDEDDQCIRGGDGGDGGA